MYVILGATGNTGTVITNTLLAKGEKVRVVGRDAGKLQKFVAKGAESFAADKNDANALAQAFAGARAALAMVRSSLAMSKRHGTIFRRFEKHVVQERGLDPSLGKDFLYRQRSARQIADYEVTEVVSPRPGRRLPAYRDFSARLSRC